MILGPIATGAGLLWLKPDQFRKILVGGIALVVCACVLALAALPLPIVFERFGLHKPLEWIHRISVPMMIGNCCFSASATTS